VIVLCSRKEVSVNETPHVLCCEHQFTLSFCCCQLATTHTTHFVDAKFKPFLLFLYWVLLCSHFPSFTSSGSLGVDNGPGWVGAASKPPPSPIHGWKQAVHTEPILSHGLAGFGLNGFAGFRMGIFG
jgi:hypothetical protein